jgi:hypothetical protein
MAGASAANVIVVHVDGNDAELAGTDVIRIHMDPNDASTPRVMTSAWGSVELVHHGVTAASRDHPPVHRQRHHERHHQ